MAYAVDVNDALLAASRAMEGAEGNSYEEDARVIYAAAAQIKAACQIAKASVQVDRRIAVPAWLINAFGSDIANVELLPEPKEET